MEIQINKSQPRIMHIDLNSCFATVEQQANPLLRGKPIVVAAYATANGCVLAPSVEAKLFGIKTGMRVKEARSLCPEVVVLSPDPPKYRDVHKRFKKIFQTYTPDVTPKSIDEAVLDFRGLENMHPNLIQVGKEIQHQIRKEIGEWMMCSVGISTNMFLAKLAASIKKPNGLILIDHKNLKEIYSRISLMDLNGINIRYKTRLNVRGIYTPIDFFSAPCSVLENQVFRSIVGRYWYEKLRGYEADQKNFPTKSIGQQYALQKITANRKELSRMLMKLCEKMGRRLRADGYTARGIHLWIDYADHTHWHRGQLMEDDLYTTQSLYQHVMHVFNLQPEFKAVVRIGVSSYYLTKVDKMQLSLFKNELKDRDISDALDQINDRWGEFTVVSGLMIDMDDIILDRIAFGRVKELQDYT